MTSSDYINEQRRDYSLYVLQSRAIPHAADGLKAAARRVLWVAKDGKKRKSATLAGECMPYHAHASPEGTINTLAAPYGNNIPLLKGDGAFGTILIPTAYGASRYTSATLSKFAADVVLRDIEIVPMIENYDSTLMEPKHFLPLIPIVLLNPQEGIAVGFASDILPRGLTDIINNQIAYLTVKGFKEPKPSFQPINQKALEKIDDKWLFKGKIERKGAVNVRITDLPYGLLHEKLENHLLGLQEKEILTEIVDDSVDVYNIMVTFKKGSLTGKSDDDILNELGLVKTIGENLNVIDFDGKNVWAPTYAELIENFCDWRLSWYKIRYERLAKNLAEEIQRYQDILLAIKKNVGSIARQTNSRSELKELLDKLGIVFVDYIADLPVYRFTEEEKLKVEQKIVEAEIKMKEYNTLLKSESERRSVYIEELKEIQTKYSKGLYNIG